MKKNWKGQKALLPHGWPSRAAGGSFLEKGPNAMRRARTCKFNDILARPNWALGLIRDTCAFSRGGGLRQIFN